MPRKLKFIKIRNEQLTNCERPIIYFFLETTKLRPDDDVLITIVTGGIE